MMNVSHRRSEYRTAKTAGLMLALFFGAACGLQAHPGSLGSGGQTTGSGGQSGSGGVQTTETGGQSGGSGGQSMETGGQGGGSGGMKLIFQLCR